MFKAGIQYDMPHKTVMFMLIISRFWIHSEGL